MHLCLILWQNQPNTGFGHFQLENVCACTYNVLCFYIIICKICHQNTVYDLHLQSMLGYVYISLQKFFKKPVASMAVCIIKSWKIQVKSILNVKIICRYLIKVVKAVLLFWPFPSLRNHCIMLKSIVDCYFSNNHYHEATIRIENLRKSRFCGIDTVNLIPLLTYFDDSHKCHFFEIFPL